MLKIKNNKLFYKNKVYKLINKDFFQGFINEDLEVNLKLKPKNENGEKRLSDMIKGFLRLKVIENDDD